MEEVGIKLTPPYQSFNIQPGQKTKLQFSLTNYESTPVEISLVPLPDSYQSWFGGDIFIGEKNIILPGEASNFVIDVQVPNQVELGSYKIAIPLTVSYEENGVPGVASQLEIQFIADLNIVESNSISNTRIEITNLPKIFLQHNPSLDISTNITNDTEYSLRPIIYTQLVGAGKRVTAKEITNSDLRALGPAESFKINTKGTFTELGLSSHSQLVTYEVLAVDRQFNQSVLAKQQFIFINPWELLIVVTVILATITILARTKINQLVNTFSARFRAN